MLLHDVIYFFLLSGAQKLHRDQWAWGEKDHFRGTGDPAYKTHLRDSIGGYIHISSPSSHIPPYSHEPKFFPIESWVKISVPKNFPPGGWAKNFPLAGLAKIFLGVRIGRNFFKRERVQVR